MRFTWRRWRRPRTTWEGIGEELSVEGSICQAAQAIDIAAKLATEDRDKERLLQAAEYWTKLADFVIAVSEHASKKDSDRKSDFKTGFQPTDKDEDDDGSTED